MKKTFAKLCALLLGGALALSLCACGDDEKPKDKDLNPPATEQGDGQDTPSQGEEEKNPPVSNPMPTSQDVYDAIQTTLGADVQNYDFTLNLAGSVTVGLFTTPDATANYDCAYRYNTQTGDLQFKRVTSGVLLYDATEYIYSSGTNRITVKMDEKGTVKKAAVEPASEGLNLINAPFVALVKSLSESEIGSIQKIADGYKAPLTLSANNQALNALCSVLGTLDTSLNLKGVQFSNPANGLGFEFALSGETLSRFKLTADVSVPVGPAATTLHLTYSQKTNAASVALPSISGIILEKSEVESEVSAINTALAAVENMDTYSLDLTAVNEMDPGWKNKAIKDSYLSRLYKYTDGKDFTSFNNSFMYKTHTEEEGKETYKYTVGNITDDENIYLIDRKGANTASVSTETLASRFDLLTDLFVLDAAKTDCIKKATAGDETTYSIYLSASAVKDLSNGIVSLINSCPAEGVIFVNNLMDEDFTVKDASLTVVMKGGAIVSMELKTEIKYNPVSGDYAENNVTLNNTLTLKVNDAENLEKAEAYTAPKISKSPILGIGDDLAGAKYFIL